MSPLLTPLVTVTLDPVQTVITAAAAVAAVVYLVGKVRRTYRIIVAAHDVIVRELDTDDTESTAGLVRAELQSNSGESMKDDLTGVTLAVGYLGRWMDELRHDFDEHLSHHEGIAGRAADSAHAGFEQIMQHAHERNTR